jgi:bla regulator protein BlaR1
MTMDTLFHATAALAGFALQSSLKASVLIVLVLLLQRLAGRHLSAHARHFLWIAVVASLVTPIGITAQIPHPVTWTTSQMDVGVPGTVTVPTPQVGNGSLAWPTDMREIPGQPLPGSGWISLADASAYVWLAGTLLFLAVVFFRQLRFARVVRAAMPADPALQSLLDECRRLTGCRRVVPLLCTDAIETPLVTGCLRPRLLLPSAAVEQLNARQLRHVFVHELMHVRHQDIAINWLLVVVHAAHWFNPLVWIGFRRLHLDRELARDVDALSHLAEDREQYGRTLLALSQPHYRRQRPAGALGVVDDYAQLHSRIMMIARGARSSRRQTVLAIMLLILLGVLAFSRPVFRRDSAVPDAPVMPVVAMMPSVVIPATRVAGAPAMAARPIAVLPARRTVKAGPAIDAPSTRISAVESSGEGFVAMAAGDGAAEAAVVAQQAPLPEEVAANRVPENGGTTTAATRETYGDWADVQTLARAAEEARDRGVQSITEWNQLAERCHSSGRKAVGCGEVSRLVTSGEVASFWRQCTRFIKTYNRLTVRFSRAEPSAFTDRNTVGKAIANSYRTLSEFCNTDVYRQKYPSLSPLIGAAVRGPQSGAGPFWWRPQYVAGAVTFEPPYSRLPSPR